MLLLELKFLLVKLRQIVMTGKEPQMFEPTPNRSHCSVVFVFGLLLLILGHDRKTVGGKKGRGVRERGKE